MASSSTEKKKEANRYLRDLEKVVEDFKGRLSERRVKMEQSSNRMSDECESNCKTVWQEFHPLMKEAGRKARALCDQMKQETSNQTSVWRLSLQKQESLLEEAERWLGDLRHLVDGGNEGVICGLRSVGDELSSQLKKSSDPIEGGHFVVTFPEWCRQSLSELPEKMLYIVAGTWPPSDLELERESPLQVSIPGFYSIAGSDKDGHVFVVDGCGRSINELDSSGVDVGSGLTVDEGEDFYPFDICRLSGDSFVVCGSYRSGSGWRGRLLFLARQKSQPFLETEKKIDAKEEKKFYSLCQMKGKIYVCDFDLKEIFSFSEEGKQIETIKIVSPPLLGLESFPLLRADPTTGRLWGTKLGMSEIFVFDPNGKIYPTVKTEGEIWDFCGDQFGQFCFCTLEGIFSVLPQKRLYEFPKRSEKLPRIFFSPLKLFVSFENDGENLMKIFKINYNK